MLPSEEVAFHKPLLFSRQPVDQKSSHASTRYLHTFSQVSYFFDNCVPSGSSLTSTPSQETRRRTRSLSPIKASGHMSGQPWLLRPHHYLVMKVKKVTAHLMPWLSKWLAAGSETELVDLVMPEGFDMWAHLTASQSGDIEISSASPVFVLSVPPLRSNLGQHRHLGFWLRPEKTCTKSSQSDGVHFWYGSISSVCYVEGTKGPPASKAALRLLVSLNRAERQHSGTGRSSDPQRQERRAHTVRDLLTIHHFYINTSL